ncbi:MAG: response regulator, partial [Chloroflexota bacterium]|nr:response regulator [Chloroflexota bacterium]
MLLEWALEKSSLFNFSVTRAETLAEAVDYLQHVSYDVVLLDLSLPDSSGLDTVEGIETAAPRVPVIVLSVADDEELILSSVRGGVQDYLVKGQIGTPLLVRSILHAIERKRIEDELRHSRDQLEVILRGVADGITVQDARGRFV